jgi:glycosyltransferase involved in cell wall biosynthesis
MNLVSVVIPTMGLRPALLRRAVERAGAVSDTLSVEIVVVLNGAASNFDLGEAAVQLSRAARCTIKVVRTSSANVSRARNKGLAASSGEIVRFLDDDDFLIPEIAQHQYVELLGSRADLSTYAGKIEDEQRTTHRVIAPPLEADYGSAVLGPNCPALTFATVYRADLIRNVSWNEAFNHTEDEDWMRRILQAGNPAWITSDHVVGVWYQHGEPRLSKPLPVAEYYRNRATSILESVQIIEREGRLSDEGRESAADGLWSAIHGGFYFAPFYWTKMARVARNWNPTSRPDGLLFSTLPHWLCPVWIEWLALPKRWYNHSLRVLKGTLFGWEKVRGI